MNEEESAIKNLLKRKDQAEKVLNRERNRCEKLSLENQDLHNEIRDLKVITSFDHFETVLRCFQPFLTDLDLPELLFIDFFG